MARLSIFQPQGQGAATVDEEPIYNKPFQPYVGKDEVNRRATSFSPRQRTMPPSIDPAQRRRVIAPGSIPPTPPPSTTGFGSTPQVGGTIPVPQPPPLTGGQTYGDVVGAGGGGINPGNGSVRPTPIPGGVQPYPVPSVPRQRAFVPSIYNTPFQQ